MPNETDNKIKQLLKLADICQEMEFVELRLSDAWCALREELGLSKLLLMIEAYVKETCQGAAQTLAPKAGHPNESANVVQ